MIEKIQNILLTTFMRYNLMHSEESDIYKFGIECLILKVMHYASYFMLSIILGCFAEFLVFILTYLVLRKYAGGIHADTRSGCLIISNIIFGAVMIIGRNIGNSNLMFVTIISVIIIIICAPVSNPNRKLTIHENKKFKIVAISICAIEIITLYFIKSLEYCKWIQLGIIICACSVFLGKIKYNKTDAK